MCVERAHPLEELAIAHSERRRQLQRALLLRERAGRRGHGGSEEGTRDLIHSVHELHPLRATAAVDGAATRRG